MCCLDMADDPAAIKPSVTMNKCNVFAFPSGGLEFYNFLFSQQHLIIAKPRFACLLDSRPRVLQTNRFSGCKMKAKLTVTGCREAGVSLLCL